MVPNDHRPAKFGSRTPFPGRRGVPYPTKIPGKARTSPMIGCPDSIGGESMLPFPIHPSPLPNRGLARLLTLTGSLPPIGPLPDHPPIRTLLHKFGMQTPGWWTAVPPLGDAASLPFLPSWGGWMQSPSLMTEGGLVGPRPAVHYFGQAVRHGWRW